MRTTRTTTTTISEQVCLFDLARNANRLEGLFVSLFKAFNEAHGDAGFSMSYQNDIHPTENPDGCIATIAIRRVETLPAP